MDSYCFSDNLKKLAEITNRKIFALFLNERNISNTNKFILIMKKLLLLALVLITATSALARSHDFVVNGITYYLNKDGKSVTVTQKRGSYSGEVIIPKEIKYLNANLVVTSIDDLAYYQCSNLTSVTIPNSVKSIGSSAFNSCPGLTSVSIPNSVKSIGSNAYSNCSGITSVTIPDSVSNIGGGAFSGCI